MMKKKLFYVYISLFLSVCLIPSAGLFFTGIREPSENRTEAHMPQLHTENGLNLYFLSNAGKWYEDHFAFRDEAVTGYALLLGKGFGISAQEKVIAGTDGWLFYKDSLADFQGTEPMTGRQLFDVAHSLAMVQEYARQNGAEFAFAAAPNKNSLYGEYMPYYYQPQRSGKSNLERLEAYLQAEQVNYIDLYECFQNDSRVLYHKRDSHWNNMGAAMAADRILNGIGKGHLSYAGRAYTARKDFQGDLERMLYPSMPGLEEEIYYDPAPQFFYCKNVESNFDPKISTRSDGDGSLVMYRDSFGNSLLPFMAEAFENAWFSRALPYHLQDLSEHEADALVIERAERFLPDMAQQAPEMEAPAVVWDAAVMGPAVKAECLEETAKGEYTQVTGKIPMHAVKEHSRIYIRADKNRCYEAFPVSTADGQEGFSLLLQTKELQDTCHMYEVYVSEQDAEAATKDQAGDADGHETREKIEIRREDYPDCDGSGHGYIEIYYSDGILETKEY